MACQLFIEDLVEEGVSRLGDCPCGNPVRNHPHRPTVGKCLFLFYLSFSICSYNSDNLFFIKTYASNFVLHVVTSLLEAGNAGKNEFVTNFHFLHHSLYQSLKFLPLHFLSFIQVKQESDVGVLLI